MKVLNQTPFGFAPLVGRLSHPRHSLTLILKGTFDLRPGDVAKLTEEQPPLGGEEYYPDDEEQTGVPRYESDFAHYKPRADLLLVGRCYTPGGSPSRECRVTFAVGGHERTLRITGDRQWDPTQRRPTLTTPKRFSEMELRYENTFGGDGYEPNPMGKGYMEVRKPKEAVKAGLALPNIMDAREKIERPGQPHEPVTLGPMPRMWGERYEKFGSYEDPWLKTRWPWFPEDFDWAHFNAAPEPMQVEGYLRGDEEVRFENLHAEYEEYRSRLPGLRVRCFLNEAERPQDADARSAFREVTMHLDTLWIDADAEKLVLLWRGHAEVASEEYEEVQHIFVLSEPLSQAAASVEACRQQFLLAWAEEEGEEAAPADEPQQAEAEQEEAVEATPEIEPPGEPDPADADEIDMDYDAEMEKARAQLREACEKSGIDPDNPPPLGPKEKKLQARVLRAIGFSDDDMLEAGVAPGDIPSGSPQELKELALLRERMGFPDEEPAAEASEEPEPVEEDSGGPTQWTRERVEARVAQGEGFASEDLSGLDLSGLALTGVDFSRARLTGATLENAVLDGAQLAEADLSRANLTGASMKGADLQQAELASARLSRADLSGAILNDAVFEKAHLEAAVLAGVKAGDAIFAEADLKGARFDNSTLDGADFSAAALDRARFQGASMKEAFLEGAVAPGVNMDRADLTGLRAGEGTNLTGGSFREASAPDSIWQGALLDGADFSYARMEGADFTKASLVKAEFFAADIKGGRLARADLRGARLVEMNLFEGTLEKASLVDADLSGSNMYGAEFLDADTTGARTDDTNLVMTKLAWS